MLPRPALLAKMRAFAWRVPGAARRPPVDGVFEALSAPETLAAAWQRVRRNRGGPGGDQLPVARVAAAAQWSLTRLRRRLLDGRYRPGPLRVVEIPKASGGARRLSIPTVTDRIAQTAAVIALTPHVDPWMSEASFAYRPGRSVAMAVDAVREGLARGQLWVVDGDIAAFFDAVPHERLLKTLGEWVADARFIDLVPSWLESFSRDGCGLAQGSPISPLLSNLYLDVIDRRIEANRRLRWVRYADDFVLLCPDHRAAERAQRAVARALAKHGLKLHQAKTRIASVGGGFSFLGHGFAVTAEPRSHQARSDLDIVGNADSLP